MTSTNLKKYHGVMSDFWLIWIGIILNRNFYLILKIWNVQNNWYLSVPLYSDILIGSYVFIRPFEKRTYYAMAMSVRLSVRPSVRPSFPDFFSTCFEISIWNLVYAFSRWHDMSSLSFITIGSLWPSLQPKVGQTQFLQSWPYKSR